VEEIRKEEKNQLLWEDHEEKKRALIMGGAGGRGLENVGPKTLFS